MESIQGIQEARWEQTQHKGKHSVGRSKGTQDKCRSRTLRWAVPQASTICPNPKARHPGSSFSARDSARFHRCTSIHLLENARGIRSTRWNERTTKQTPAGKKLKMPQDDGAERDTDREKAFLACLRGRERPCVVTNLAARDSSPRTARKE
jgi:hypothetical protein